MGMMVLVIRTVAMIVLMMAVVVIVFVRMTADLYVAATESASTFFAHTINSARARGSNRTRFAHRRREYH